MSIDLYTLHSTAAPGEYIIQKFTTDYECKAVYALSREDCNCPQGIKPYCKHRKMLELFLKHNHIADGWFLEWQTRLWRRPVNDAFAQLPEGVTAVGLEDPEQLHNTIAEAVGEKQFTHELADETVMGTSANAGDGTSVLSTSPAQGIETPVKAQAVSPPSPPEGLQPAQAAEATTPASPVVAGAQTVKRRKVGP